MKTEKIKEIIDVLELKIVQDIKINENEVYALNLKTRLVGIVFYKDHIEIFIFVDGKETPNFKRLFASAEGKELDIYDMKIVFDFLFTYEENMLINKIYRKNKK